jgi:hypothetical protein
MARSLGYSNEPHIRVAEAGTRNNSAFDSVDDTWLSDDVRGHMEEKNTHISQIVSKVDM